MRTATTIITILVFSGCHLPCHHLLSDYIVISSDGSEKQIQTPLKVFVDLNALSASERHLQTPLKVWVDLNPLSGDWPASNPSILTVAHTSVSKIQGHKVGGVNVREIHTDILDAIHFAQYQIAGSVLSERAVEIVTARRNIDTLAVQHRVTCELLPNDKISIRVLSRAHGEFGGYLAVPPHITDHFLMGLLKNLERPF